MIEENQHVSFSVLREAIDQARYNALKVANAELVNLYWQVGAFVSKQLSESKWGDKAVKQLANFLQKTDPGLKGFDQKSIYRMVQFYDTYKISSIVATPWRQLESVDNQSSEFVATPWRQIETSEQEKVATLWRQFRSENIRQTILVKISWSIHKIIIGRTRIEEEREFYLRMCVKENYSVRELDRQISAGLFERVMIGNKKLSASIKKTHPNILNNFKDSYVFEFLNLPETHSEDDLQKALIRQMKQFILELGKDYIFIGEEYKIQVGNRDFLMDLLFYHRGLQCLVAFELKKERFEPEYLGKVNFYLEALDRDVKKPNENPSIGILLCKDNDKHVVEYALNRSMSPTMIAEYKTQLPDKKCCNKNCTNCLKIILKGLNENNAMKLFAILFAIVLCSYVHATSPLQPASLTCEYVTNPLGIDTKSPRLSWNFTSTERNQIQTAYEIIVSNNLQEINKGIGDSWASNKIMSGQNIQIEYAGKPLQSFTRYYWRVKVYNQKGEASEWSSINWFETAMLAANDWKAQWISDGSKNPQRDEDYYKPDQMPLLRKSFNASKKILSARLYISGVGYYEAYLNGKKISDNVLDPGFTTYRKQVMYVVHDITPMIRKGNNTAGIMLGSGWWNPLPFKFFGRWDLREYQQTGRPCVKAEIHVRYTDGAQEIIATDEFWQTAAGPITQNNVYIGEHYDARLEPANWNNAGEEKSVWKNAVAVAGPEGMLTAQMQPPIRVTKIVKPIKIIQYKPGIFIADMGQNFAGVANIKVKGAAGTTIALRYGEELLEDGSLNTMTTSATQIKKGGIKSPPGAPESLWQEDRYTLKGVGVEEWHPRFTFHGFRYVEIAGWPGTPTVNDIEGLRMNTDFLQNGNFACSDSMFNKLHDVIQWTFLSNVFSVQSDCPGREKMGYGADIAVTANAYMYNYNMANFYAKTVRDYANEQQPDGGITEIAPFTGIADRGYGGASGPLGWELAFPYVQKQLYDMYGDKRIIENNYEAFVKQLSFLESKAKDNNFYWDISDHEALDPKPEALTATAFYYHHVAMGAEFAGILGKHDDSVKYAKLAQQIKVTIAAKYLLPGTGRFDNGTESAQLFALWYGLSPEKDNTMKALVQEFERHNWHVSTGIFSTKMLFDVLRENDMNEEACRIAQQKDYPGWINMLNHGATTLWEAWHAPGTVYSANHPMFGSIDEWFYRSLLGINAAAPGFKKIIIKPQPAGGISFAKGSYQSVMGVIKSDWKKDGDRFTLQVSVPANTSTTIFIPSKQGASITESGKPVTASRYEKGYTVVERGSGDYQFSVN